MQPRPESSDTVIMRVCILALLLILSPQAQASYRLYQLKITYLDSGTKKPRVETVMSTLDPYQWENYNGVYGLAKVEMLDTWYCPGDTSRHGYCAKPKVNDRTLASTYPGRVRFPYPYNRQPVIP